jgi:hypothetical protein
MSDRTKIYGGIIVFLVLITMPVWYNLAMGKARYRPDIVKPAGGGTCMMDTEYMKTRHMDLLNTWRDEYVREGKMMHKAPDGKMYVKSLSNTCLDCHSNKTEFCDRCHSYAGVDPYCWDCHVIPRKGR